MTERRLSTWTSSVGAHKACLLAVLVVLIPLVVAPISSSHAKPRTIHVFVALADNQNQGIVPVPTALGNGEGPAGNLYWGARFGLKAFFKASAEWELLATIEKPRDAVLERCVFKHRNADVYLIADAYRGSRIRDAIVDFLNAAASRSAEAISVSTKANPVTLAATGGSDLAVYIGHDGLMDFSIPAEDARQARSEKKVIVLACASKAYFAPHVRAAGAFPLLWTTGLMAPEAYTLKAALEGWIAGESDDSIRLRAARSYDQYQKCGLRAAQRLFATGW
ncbi:MAG: hypothetical protein WBC04_10700 [Candidatus Acidiferrales bacterium]